MAFRLSSIQLSAFFEVARLGSFTKAADRLGVTQSALSQRISNLEEELRTALFVRTPSGPQLTGTGETLLRHCQTTEALELEVLGHLLHPDTQLSGTLRIAAYSSITQSVVIPALSSLIRSYPELNFQVNSFETGDLERVLRSSEADFIIADFRLQKAGILEHLLGHEHYVVIESRSHPPAENVFLDHDSFDRTTIEFFSTQKKASKKLKRNFLGDVHGIIRGVELGLGRAVMSAHLIHENQAVRIVKGYSPYTRPVVLHYFERPYYSRLHQEVVRHFETEAKAYLPHFTPKRLNNSSI